MAAEIALVVAFNEEGRVGEVVRELRRSQPAVRIVVVDDGSADGTRAEAIGAGAAVVSHPFNLGYGAALRTGYLYALEHDAARCVLLDGDGQHDPAAAGTVLGPLRSGEADVVIGSRFLVPTGTEMSSVRRLGVRVIALLATVVTGQHWHDAMSGYLGLDRGALQLLTTEILADDYADLDVLIALWGAGLRIVEVPMTMRARSGGRSMLSGMRILHYVYKMGLSIVMAAARARLGRALRRAARVPAPVGRRS
ncbi:MAG: glycosyltransferase family 2 protein [Elusimicrobia bacterium]|nr:glycosyltransferase family 2 protein [Elusimicrobiota bacterium]